MGLMRWLRRLLGRRRFPDKRIREALGPWQSYEGSSFLGKTRLPRYLQLPAAARKWGAEPGAQPLNNVLFSCWLRLDARLVGFLLKRLRAGAGYRCVELERPGKAPRLICEPWPVLKFVQRRILTRILEQIPVHPAAHGFVKSRSIFTNAAAHTGQRVVVTMDLRDFFPSITFPRVAGMLRQCGFRRGTAATLAGLCCYRGCLPQGAPTSPMISNLICRRLDARLTGLLTAHGGRYTRYADDLTLSGDEVILSLLPLVRRIIKDEGFTLAPEKFRIQRSGSRQRVTGLNVNSKVSVPRRVRRLLRAMVHRQADSPAPDRQMVRFLRGHLAFMRPAHPDQARQLECELSEC